MEAKYLGVFKDGHGGEAVINPDHVVRLVASGTGDVTGHLASGETIPLHDDLEAAAFKLGWALHDNDVDMTAPADTFLAEHGMA